jgi:DNA-binding IscR family transcriptional regulator
MILPLIDKTILNAIIICSYLFCLHKLSHKYSTKCRSISKETGIDIYTTRKICDKLVKHGIITSTMGNTGGYIINDDVQISKIIEAFKSNGIFDDSIITSRILTLMNRIIKVNISELVDED